MSMTRRKDYVQRDDVPGIGTIEFRIPWQGIGHQHTESNPLLVPTMCKYRGLIEDCPARVTKERDP